METTRRPMFCSEREELSLSKIIIIIIISETTQNIRPQYYVKTSQLIKLSKKESVIAIYSYFAASVANSYH